MMHVPRREDDPWWVMVLVVLANSSPYIGIMILYTYMLWRDGGAQ